MEALIALAVIGCSIYGLGGLVRRGVNAVRNRSQRHRDRRAERDAEQTRRAMQHRQQAEAARRQRAAEARLAMLRRTLVAALTQISQAPDFRRDANLAAHAASLPLSVRQGLFRQFRRHFVAYCATRLSAGENSEVLVESLRTLLTHLGVAAFEADYIKAEAERRTTRETPSAAPTYADRIAGLQREHDGRVAVLRSLASLDADTRQQLIEAEESRFRQELIESGEAART